jgi:hypothetical protein
MIFPRFRGHPNRRDNAPGVIYGQEESQGQESATAAAPLRCNVQGRGSAALQGGDRSIAQVAVDLDLTETALREWLKRADLDVGEGPPGALTTDERAELSRLRRENKRLQMEREILKKAAAFFAKENS